MKRFTEHGNTVRKEAEKATKRAWPLITIIFVALVLLMFASIIKSSLFTHTEKESRFFFEISFLMLAALLARLLVSFSRQPVVMLLIFVGVFLSPSFLGAFWPVFSGVANTLLAPLSPWPRFPLEVPTPVNYDEVVKTLAQLGAIILLFKIGTHSEVGKVFTLRNFFVAFFGVLLPFAGGYYLGIHFGYNQAASLFMAAAFTATSVGVSVAILDELKVLSTGFAKLLLGAAVIDDILGLLSLSLVLNITGSAGFSLSPLIDVSLKALVFLLGGVLAGSIFVKKYLDGLPAGDSRVFLSSLCFLMFYAYTAETIGLSAIVGAFLAGLALNYSVHKNSIIESISPLEMFLTPIFFISLGLLVDVNAIYEYAVPIMIFSVVAIMTKFVGCGAAALVSGSKLTDAAVVGVGMVPRGEVAFIIGLYGLTMGVFTAPEYSVVTAMAFITTAVTPPVLSFLINKAKTTNVLPG